MPDRRGLFLHSGLSAGDRLSGSGSAFPLGHPGSGPGHPVCGLAAVSTCCRIQSQRSGQYRHARAPLSRVGRQGVCASPAGICFYGLHHHHDAFGRRRRGSLRSQPLCSALAHGSAPGYLAVAGGVERYLSQRLQRGNWHCGCTRGCVSGAERHRYGKGARSGDPKSHSDPPMEAGFAYAAP